MPKTTAWVTTVKVLVCGVLLVGALPVRAADERPLKDDQCTAQCDEQSDKCTAQAGKDKAKRDSCDKEYDACLAKCAS